MKRSLRYVPALGLTLLACEPAPKPPIETPPAPPAGATSVSAAGQWDAELLSIAAAYPSYGVVAVQPNWAPTLCAAPAPPPSQDQPRLSGAEPGSAHGEKLYFLYAKDRIGYGKASTQNLEAEVGQVIVKEAFAPVEVAENAAKNPKRVARKGAHVFEPGERIALFVMKKVAKDTPGTDQGWVYAVIDGAGKTVKASGALELCVKCHANAPHDRLFAKDI
jgi:hypothetical protein